MIQITGQLLYFGIFAFFVTIFVNYQRKDTKRKKLAIKTRLACEIDDFRLVREKDSGNWFVYHKDNVYKVVFSEESSKVVYIQEKER